MRTQTEAGSDAVAGQVERPVRPRAWACMWPAEDGCGGGGFTTLDESTALNYMAGANESADSGRSKCRPTLVPLYDQATLDAAVTAERERCARLPALPKPRVLATGTVAGKYTELRGWYTEDIEIWKRQHGLKFGA